MMVEYRFSFDAIILIQTFGKNIYKRLLVYKNKGPGSITVLFGLRFSENIMFLFSFGFIFTE